LSVSKSVTIAMCVSVLFAAGAAGSYARARQLRADAEWLMARGNAEAQQYADSFEVSHADNQLKSFDERREVLEKAGRFHALQLLSTLGTVLSAFAAYVLYLYWRLRQQLVDATEGGNDHQHLIATGTLPVR
jgi:hypothetical protein